VCNALEIRLEVGTADWPRDAAGVSEADARDARMGFFKQAMAEVGVAMLFLGQQKNDVAETMLMRLARGSGAGGLAAPRSR
jgi:tRNA(Ile)-lysidine synthase